VTSRVKNHQWETIMKRAFLTAFFLATLIYTAYSQYVVDSTLLLSKKDMQWWRDAKFGLFIHFGLFSILGRGEWVMFSERKGGAARSVPVFIIDTGTVGNLYH
jgi:hypothetical protein